MKTPQEYADQIVRERHGMAPYSIMGAERAQKLIVEAIEQYREDLAVDMIAAREAVNRTFQEQSPESEIDALKAARDRFEQVVFEIGGPWMVPGGILR